ncbi:hypothetical protein BN85310840 [Paracholeplasma brassicae]|uniref:Uncharacterized protein n=1 Tax=Acholeplasma brassicae TaxID=61635 RepID=U4KP41_9MOLU|nr:hypothetical protein BN85310840 [Paracholeplasma brassicae]
MHNKTILFSREWNKKSHGYQMSESNLTSFLLAKKEESKKWVDA